MADRSASVQLQLQQAYETLSLALHPESYRGEVSRSNTNLVSLFPVGIRLAPCVHVWVVPKDLVRGNT